LGTLLTACLSPAHAADNKPPQAAKPGEKIFGIVTAKSDKSITIKIEGEDEAKSYSLSNKGGAPKADVQAALKMVFPTNLVVFQFQGDQDRLLTGIQAMHSKTRTGTTAGTVVAVDPKAGMPFIDVKPAGKGHTERYVARWDPATKSCDKKLVQIIGGMNPGDKVKIGWYYDERKRAVQIQVVGKAKAATEESK
jgi:hypothetical protein